MWHWWNRVRLHKSGEGSADSTDLPLKKQYNFPFMIVNLNVNYNITIYYYFIGKLLVARQNWSSASKVK